MNAVEPPAVEPTGAPDDVLRVEHLAKSFGAITALRDVSLHLRKGEVLGLIGDNGAGKSTLVKILSGYHQPDAGTISLFGNQVHLKSVIHARSLGVDTVYQDLALVPGLSVFHNMFLKREHTRFSVLNNGSMRGLAREHPWEEVVDALYARDGHYHWVHAINNTALTAAALYAFDGDFSGGICAVVQGGLDTDTNGAAVGSILGALAGAAGIEERWSAPLGGRFTSSLPGFDGITLHELVRRTIAVAGAPATA